MTDYSVTGLLRILYAFFGKAKQCPGRGAGALLRPSASRSFLVPLRRNAGSSRQARQIGPPFENRIRPAPGRLRHSYDADASVARARAASRSARVLFAWGCVAPRPRTRARATRMAVTLKAAVSRAAESDCQTDRTRRLSAVIRRRDRSGSSRPRSERRASTVPAAPSKTGGDLDCWTSCPLSGQMNGAPGRTRTSCLRFRKPPLCPGELREQGSPEDAGARPCALRHGCIRALRARSSHRRALTRPGCGGLRRRIL